MKLTVMFDYDKKVGWVTVVGGPVTPDIFINYLDTCRKNMGSEWISVVDMYNAQRAEVFSIKDMATISIKSIAVGKSHPIKALILISNDPVIAGLTAVFVRMVDADQGRGSVYAVSTREECDRVIEKIRNRK